MSGVSHDAETPTVAQVVGWNAKRLRGDVAGDRLASAAKKRGLKWGTGRIADLEAGRVSPTLSTLVSLALALGDVRGEPIKLQELVYWDGFVSVSGDLMLTGEALARYVASNWPVQVVLRDTPGGRQKLNKLMDYLDKDNMDERHLADINPRLTKVSKTKRANVFEGSGEAEERAAKSLDVGVYELAAASAYLWGKTLSDERDARAGDGASAQKRGRITRQLIDELRVVLRRVVARDGG